jgi:DNA-binding response OmpR family regulator
VRAHLRRAGSEDDREAPEPLAARDVRVDLAARRAWRGEAELALRPKEFDLLALLVREAGRVVTRERIMREVWDTDWLGSTKTLDTHVLTLRGKVGAEAIVTLRGVGYRFERA